ncbi:MAG: hypothetical protein MUC65_06960, partial [Pontiellaceae bacterium]|nr:hypothetical protein [Pontiellaceae bacterium]
MKKGLLRAVVFLVLGAGSFGFADRLWTNSVGGSWSEASNWEPNGVPDAGDRVTIPAGIAVQIGVTAYCRGFTLNPGGVLTVSSSGSLDIGGDTSIYGAMVNEGTVNWTNGTVTVYNYDPWGYNGVISNRAGAVWNVLCDDYNINGNWGVEQFVNQGTLRKISGTGNTLINVVLNSSGLLNSQSGNFY